MAKTLHARIAPDISAALEQLKAKTGKTESALVREGLELLVQLTLAGDASASREPRLLGMGMFASGIDDLGSNKDHLKGFGK